MTNAELIDALRRLYTVQDTDNIEDWVYGSQQAMCDAADALEADEQRIADLEAQMPKEGEWNDANGADVPLDKDGDTTDSCYCSICGDWLTASDEYATRGRYCPNCGAKMRKGANDEQIH